MKIKTALVFALLLSPVFVFAAAAEDTVISIDAGVTVNTFKPFNIFGNNTNGWASPVPVKDKIQEAGNFILRYPGGSWGDVFFWNGSGDYDKNGNWVASDTEYTNSRMMKDNGMLYDASRIRDNDDSTAWRSNADTDFPNGQWVYLDFQGKKSPDKLEITWGNAANKDWPYARKFTIQYWDPKEGRQWMVYGAENNAWLDTTVKDAAGTGGKQTVLFTPAMTQYIRILMTESSAGRNGTYSIAGIKAFAGGDELVIKDNNSVVTSSVNPACELGDRKIFGFEDYMAFMQSFTPHAEPLIIVNIGSGTPQLAASWVKYANITKKYGIKYWEIGNENGGQWECGGPMNVYDYTRKLIKYYEAMKAVDPSITIIAQCVYDGASGAYDGVPGIRALADRLAKEKKTDHIDGWVIHDYPKWDAQVTDLLASPKNEMADLAANLKKQLAKYPKLAMLPVWITEFNTSDHVKPHDISVHLENSLWLAQYVCEFIRSFGSRGYTTMWDTLNGGNALTDPNAGDHGYMQAEEGAYQYQERADYWAMKMMTNYWSNPGDTNDHKLVKCDVDDPLIASYADLKPDGSLALLVVNKDPDNTCNITVKFKGFKPAAEAKAWKFDKNNYRWDTDSPPYHADPDNAPSESDVKGVSDSFKYPFPAYSITVIQFNSSEKTK